MSYLYALDPVGQAKLSDQLDNQAPTPPQVGAFDNFWGAVSGGFEAGVLKLGELSTHFKSEGEMAARQMLGPEFEAELDAGKEAARKQLAKKADEVMPNPIKTGWASNIVGGFAQVIPTAVVGGAMLGPVGAAGLVGGAQGVGEYERLLREGVDPTTAAKAAGVTGVASGLGVALPMSVSGVGLLANLGIGAGVNVGMGMAQRGATSSILEAGGYHDMAQQYKWLDGEAIAVDALLGAAFGGLGHTMHGAPEAREARPSPDHVDAALALNDRLHVESEAQPGIHLTPESRDAGVRAMDEAVRDMVERDRMPDVAEHGAKMDVEPNPAVRQFHEEAAKTLEGELPKREKPVDTLTEAERVAKDAKAEELQNKVDRLEAKGKEPAAEGEPLKPHDNTPEGMAKAGDVQPAEHAMAQQVLAAHPDLELPTGRTLEDGTPETAKFSDVLKNLDKEISDAKRDTVLHDVAVACFLRG